MLKMIICTNFGDPDSVVFYFSCGKTYNSSAKADCGLWHPAWWALLIVHILFHSAVWPAMKTNHVVKTYMHKIKVLTICQLAEIIQLLGALPSYPDFRELLSP